MPGAARLACELDGQVCELTRRNLSVIESPIQLVRNDYLHALGQLTVDDDVLVIAFIAPPWGTAFSATHGLDLRDTSPPVHEILDALARQFHNRMLFAVQVCERMVPDSLAEIRARGDWSTLKIYDTHKRLTIATGCCY